MTKKDYEAAAAIVAAITPERDRALCADTFAKFFAAENPRFARPRFLKACRVEGEKPFSLPKARKLA